jgi:hypothetical protein
MVPFGACFSSTLADIPAVELRLLLLLLLYLCDQRSPLEVKRMLQSLEKVT